MDERQKKRAKLSLAGVLLGTAAVVSVVRWNAVAGGGGERGIRVFFYDLSEKRLYAAARDTLAPDAGVGGEAGDGVRAVVVAPRGARGDESARRIAYLETYTPALYEKLAVVQAAKRAGQGGGVKGPSGDDPFVLKNTLVRRESESTWHDLTTADARAILNEWASWKDDAGEALVVVSPS